MWLFSSLKAFKSVNKSQTISQYLLFHPYKESITAIAKCNSLPFDCAHSHQLQVKVCIIMSCQKSSLLPRIIITGWMLTNLAPQPHTICLLFTIIYDAHYLSLSFSREQHPWYRFMCNLSIYKCNLRGWRKDKYLSAHISYYPSVTLTLLTML